MGDVALTGRERLRSPSVKNTTNIDFNAISSYNYYELLKTNALKEGLDKMEYAHTLLTEAQRHRGTGLVCPFIYRKTTGACFL